MSKTYTAEIIGVGTELLLGNTANTDAKDISEMISALGINVFYHTVVGDNPQRLKDVVQIAKKRADIIITTGGLGPTCDDLTKQVLAESFGLTLYCDEEEKERIISFFQRRLCGTQMTDNNLQQAMLPEGCIVFRNEWGTAPGCAFFAEDTHVLMLPGPPRECRAMFRYCAVPYLKKLSNSEIDSHNIHIFGEGESAVEDRLRALMNELQNPTLAPYAKEGEVMLRVTAKAKSREEAEAMMAPVIAQVQDVLGDVIYGIDVETLEQTVSQQLVQRGETLAVAESCTGGLLSKRLTDIPGASQSFAGGVTVYTNAAKDALLGIPQTLIEEKGAVSQEIAVEMAKRVRTTLHTSYGIGITGLAGPENDGVQEVGTVFVALATEDAVFVRPLSLGAGRERIRVMSANHGLDMLRRYIQELPVSEYKMNEKSK